MSTESTKKNFDQGDSGPDLIFIKYFDRGTVDLMLFFKVLCKRKENVNGSHKKEFRPGAGRGHHIFTKYFLNKNRKCQLNPRKRISTRGTADLMLFL